MPQLFVATGADKWGDYKEIPWTIGWQPSYRTEAQIYTKYILQHKPDAKIAILYQNDDFGKDYLAGVKDVLGDKFGKMVITASYETTDPTVDSQITQLQASWRGCVVGRRYPQVRRAGDQEGARSELEADVLPVQRVAISVGAVMNPAGPENGIGIISAAYLKDSIGSDLEE